MKKTRAPRQHNWLKVSIGLNIVMLLAVTVFFVLLKTTHIFDYPAVSYGGETLCSSSFRDTTLANARKEGDEKHAQQRAASLDFFCARGDAQRYLSDGLNAYYRSLGIE